MDQREKIVVATTLHEPVFRLKEIIPRALPLIKNLFSKIVICVSKPTTEEVMDFLKNKGFTVIKNDTNANIDTYRKAIERAIKLIHDDKVQRILSLDFDRLIHWAWKYPEELIKTIKASENFELIHISRSCHAFETHPATQQETEGLVNLLASKALGFPNTIDIISVCDFFTKSLAEKMLNLKNFTKTGFYCTWPMLLWILAKSKTYIEVEGQEWETPDRFEDEIKKFGYKSWLKEFQTSEEWARRVQLLKESVLEWSELVECSIMKNFFLKNESKKK